MGRELWSQAGEPTWAIDERLRRLEVRVQRLADLVAELVAERLAESSAERLAEPLADPVRTGPDDRAAEVNRPCRCHQVVSNGGGRGGGAS